MSTTYSYTLPTVDGTQVKYYTATSGNRNPGVLTTSSTGFSIVTPTNTAGVYVLAYDANSSTLTFVNKESSTSGDAPPVGEAKGALYIKSTTAGDISWEAFDAGVLVANGVESNVTSLSVKDNGYYVIKYNNGNYSLSPTGNTTTYPSGILVGNNTTLTGIAASPDNFETTTTSNLYAINVTGTNSSTLIYSLLQIPANAMIYYNNGAIKSITLPENSDDAYYGLHYTTSNQSYVYSKIPTPPENNGIVVHNNFEYTVLKPDDNSDGIYYLKYSDNISKVGVVKFEPGFLYADDTSSSMKGISIVNGDSIISSSGESPTLKKIPTGLLYGNSEGINSVNISTPGNYVLKYSNNEFSALTLPSTSNGILIYDAVESVYSCINAQSGTYYLKGAQKSGKWYFILENAYVNNYNGINYVANIADYIPNVMRFQELEDADSSACYTIKASTQSIPNQGRTLTLTAQRIEPGIMYGTSGHNVKYASFPSGNTDDQYVIKYNSDDELIYLSPFTATATVSVPASGILVGSAGNSIGSIKTSSNVDDTFVINFSKGSTGVDDGTYSLKSLNTLLPTITTSFGSPFLFNLAESQQSSVFVTLTNNNYYCSTQVSIPTYALKTIGVQTRVDVEGIYRVNFDATKTILKVDQDFSSSLAFPNENMVDLTFILAFNDNYVYVSNFTDNSLAKIGAWTGICTNWDNDGYNFKVETTKNYDLFYITGDDNAGSTDISMTNNISAIPITNSPPFEYRYFKTSLYFTAGNLTQFDAVDSDTPKLYIFYGYTVSDTTLLAAGVSIANVNITVYSSAIPSLPVP